MMNKELKTLALSDIRQLYKEYLIKANVSQNTIQTSLSDAFYIWRKVGVSEFWSIIESQDFDNVSFSILNKLLPNQGNGKPNKNISGYLYHLRRFRRFFFNEEIGVQPISSKPRKQHKQKPTVFVPSPCQSEVEKYLDLWKAMADYSSQEAALDKLFFKFTPYNTTIEDILLKVATLNDFYSTNIFSVFPIATHILSLDIDERLQQGDPNLVNEIMAVNGRNYYSFATKYCSHHNPLAYPIYDSYVEKMLIYFRNLDGFSAFKTTDLKEYRKFKETILAFQEYYGLANYTLKEIDQYLWQLGKEYFPNNYSQKKK